MLRPRTYGGLSGETRAREKAALKRVVSGGRADVKRLRGAQGNADLFWLRVGDYRNVFTVAGNEIRVTRIIHRTEGYDWL